MAVSDLKGNYKIAIILTLFLILGNQLIIQFFLAQNTSDAKMINISGRQRMLSQRVASYLQGYQFNPSEKNKQALNNAISQWTVTHYALLNGNEDLGISKLEKTVLPALDSLSHQVEFANRMSQSKQLTPQEINDFLENQDTFLVKMNKIVNRLETSSEQKLRQTSVVEIILGGLALTVIFGEIFLIFLPMTNKLKTQNLSLSQANATLEEYAYIASHDLRSPIQNILNFLGLLKEKGYGKLGEDEKKYFDFITSSAERMDETTKDLLVFSTANQVNKSVENPKSILETVLNDLDKIIHNRNAKIEIHKLPHRVNVDKVLFGLLMRNIVSNAIKFTPKNKSPKVVISAKETEKEIIFAVADNGIGIPQKQYDNIFGLFKRLHNQRKYKGTGIGLALSKRIAEAHGGSITIKSQQDLGSTFFIEIPKL